MERLETLPLKPGSRCLHDGAEPFQRYTAVSGVHCGAVYLDHFQHPLSWYFVDAAIRTKTSVVDEQLNFDLVVRSEFVNFLRGFRTRQVRCEYFRADLMFS